MIDALKPTKYKSIEPFKHDCDRCKWIGWKTEQAPGKDGVFVHRLSNMYICGDRNGYYTLIFRYSDEPSDYSSYEFSLERENLKGSISVPEED